MDEGPSPIVFSFNWIKGTCFINRCYLGITCNTLVASIMQMLLHTCYMMLIFSAVTLVIVPSKTEFVNCFSHVLLSTFIASQKIDQSHVMAINPFYSSVTFLYPLKTSENQRFSDVFRGYRNVTLD